MSQTQQPAFSTCDLLDEHPHWAAIPAAWNGKSFRSYGGRRAFTGAVVTVKCFEDNSRVKELLATPGAGRVLIVDGGESMRCALLGDLIAASAVANAWSGVIIAGCVRDVDALSPMDLGVQALAHTPQKSTRKGVGETDIAIHIAGVRIQSGDICYADGNGIVIAPMGESMTE